MDGHRHEGGIQGSIERSARVSRIVFTSPPALAAYAFVVVASATFGLVLEPTLRGALSGFIVIGVPALLAGPLSTPLANLLGGTLYYKRAAFLAAVGVTLIGAVLLLYVPLRLVLDVPVIYALLLGYMVITSVRHAVLYATSDNRHFRTLPVSLLQTAVGIPFVGILYDFGEPEILLALLLPFAFLVPLIFFLHIYDTPLKRNFGVSASELFRYYLDHLTSGRMDGEEIINRFAEPITAKFGAVVFRRKVDRSLKAVIVVPALHPGPIGRLGGSDLPGKIADALGEADAVLVPHGAATHDYNPVSTREVERLGRAVRELVQKVEDREGGTKARTGGTDVRVTCQVFGDGALLTYTSWPAPIDDVEYGVGLAAEMSARLAGPANALFVDCHNSLTPGAGAVFLCTPRADDIIQNARTASEMAMQERVGALKVGVAQDRKAFSKAQGIGDQGVQAVVVDAEGERTAYVLWDGNNAVPEVTALIGKRLEGVVDAFQVMTTDNHAVNAVAGSYGPVGHLAKPEDIAEVTRAVVEDAIANLEPVTSGVAVGHLENFRVFGNQKTVQLTSSINVMTSIILELVAACLVVQGLAAALLFYVLGVL